jgi:hypothetical protein
MSRDMIIFLVIMAVTLVIVLAIFTPWKKATDYGAKKEMCRNSFLMHTLTTAIGTPTDIECQTNFFTLSYDAGTDKGREMIKREIADLWLDACDVFDYGKHALSTKQSTFCAVYAVVDFEKKGKEVPGMYDYLLNTNAPGTGQKYVSSCAAYETDPGKIIAEFEKLKNVNPISDTIDTSKKYAVIFVYSNKNDIITNFKNYFGGGWKASGIGGAVVSTVTAGLIIGTGGTFALAIGATTGAVAAYEIATGGKPSQGYSLFLIREYTDETMKELGCDEFPVVQGYRPQ